MPSPIILYDLIPTDTSSGPSFSPFCMRARLALLRKNVEFETKFITYHELRFGGWKEKLGVELASAPIIRKPDGQFLMDSTKIALWLDESYPSEPNLFLPFSTPSSHSHSDFHATSSEEYDKAVKEYSTAVDNFDSILKSVACPDEDLASKEGNRKRGEFWCSIFSLYAKRIVRLFDQETAEYWIDDGRLGEGTWKSIVSSNDDELVKLVQKGAERLSQHLSSKNQEFFTSPSQPGMTDFALFGDLQLLRSVSPSLFEKCFLEPREGLRDWVVRMDEMFPMEDVRERDSKEEIEVCTE